MVKRVIILFLFFVFVFVNVGLADTRNSTVLHPCPNTGEGMCETVTIDGRVVYDGHVPLNTTVYGLDNYTIRVSLCSTSINSRQLCQRILKLEPNHIPSVVGMGLFLDVNGGMTTVNTNEYLIRYHPCNNNRGACETDYMNGYVVYDGADRRTIINNTVNKTPTVTSTPTVIATPTPATPTNTPIPIVSSTPSEFDMSNATIVQPCDDNSNKMCESIMKNGVTVYKGPVYPEIIDVNNPGEPIFPINDPNYKNHVGISHPCTPTGNIPTYSQMCDASYINGHLTYIIKYTHKEYPCSIDVSGICRENSQESIPVRTPIVLTGTPTIQAIDGRPNDLQPTVVTPRPIETPERKQATTNDVITFVTPDSGGTHGEQNQQETKISWLESTMKSITTFIKSIF
jgi:hypothetical protein